MTATTPQRQTKRDTKLLPKHERYLDAFHRFQFLKPQHLQRLSTAPLSERTLRFDLMKLASAGYLSRTRNNKDEEYTYFPASIREKSPLMLDHTNEITWVQILLETGAPVHGIEIVASERRAAQIVFTALMKNADGALKTRRCIPDLLCVIRNTAKPASRGAGCFFWEITNAKPGQHWRKENDIVQKCEMYNAYFDSGDFVDRLQKEMHLEVKNFRVILTFPTEQRARNFAAILHQKKTSYPGRFWVTWQEAYHRDMYEPIFLSVKDGSLHSFKD
jgi:hypothetical protein